MTTLKLWLSTIANTFTSIGALLVFAIIYAALVLSSWFFISTREATLRQVLVTYVLMFVIPALFFLFQASLINRAREQKFRWGTILIDAIKFFIVAIPILLIAWLVYYLLNKWQAHHLPPVIAVLPSAAETKSQPLHWPTLLFATLRFALLGVVLPLSAIHLWIAVAGSDLRTWIDQGGKPFLKKISYALATAFGPESVLIYALGMIVFVVLPYTILFVPLSPKGNKTDFAAFILRLLLTYLFTLIGWVVTISALTRNAGDSSPAPAPSPDRSPAVPLEAAA
jgi:hypothetical protein